MATFSLTSLLYVSKVKHGRGSSRGQGFRYFREVIIFQTSCTQFWKIPKGCNDSAGLPLVWACCGFKILYAQISSAPSQTSVKRSLPGVVCLRSSVYKWLVGFADAKDSSPFQVPASGGSAIVGKYMSRPSPHQARPLWKWWESAHVRLQ